MCHNHVVVDIRQEAAASIMDSLHRVPAGGSDDDAKGEVVLNRLAPLLVKRVYFQGCMPSSCTRGILEPFGRVIRLVQVTLCLERVVQPIHVEVLDHISLKVPACLQEVLLDFLR